MTIGGIAALIAALAFLLLVIFLCVTLVHVVKVLDGVSQNLEKVTGDINALSHQTDELLGTVNAKINQVDPVFQAAADIGTTVSDVNNGTRKAVENLKKRVELVTKTSVFSIATNQISKRFSKAKRKKQNKTSQPAKTKA
ncbi:DUF948 domain-containing protein [Fructilactobacillus myrtifloralis]|uniref:DUF948 domain-containing protein n=1 Tax=Fructilactobacillus myrtifloralis TaxID=2940301 RepID=A0ABY5BNF1_9LACO|nr:DUF948 domain-containing protein [Fructilactobacillus myrtifloralis]USS85197.1 DUF948 domain-containing protein [Fructilactobacillus myrtifloralis]